MAALFDIVGEFQKLYELATEDGNEEVFADTLEALTGELEAKGAGYVAVIQQIEMEEEKADELVKKYAAIRDSRKNAAKKMKDRLLVSMDALDKTEFPAGDYTIKAQTNGGKVPLKITGDVPEKFTRVIVEPDNDKIREYLKDNDNACEWAHLEPRGRHIKIK